MKTRSIGRFANATRIVLTILFLFAGATQADITQGLIASFPFSGNGLDVSGYDNHSLANGALLAEDRFGQANSAYVFDGANDTLYALNSLSLNPQSAVTISVWIYLESYPSNWSSIVNKWHSYVLQLHPDYGLSLMIFDQTSKAIMRGVAPQFDFELHTWYHIAASYDETTGAAAWYINGEAKSYLPRPPYGYPSLLNSSTDNLKIGSENDNQWWHGKIDDVRIYDRMLSEADVIELFNDQSTYIPVKPAPAMMNLTIGGIEVDLTTGAIRLQANIDPNDPALLQLLANPKLRISIEMETGDSEMGIISQTTIQSTTQMSPAKLSYGILTDTTIPTPDSNICEIVHDYGHHYGREKDKENEKDKEKSRHFSNGRR